AASITGITTAIAAFGTFFNPKSFGLSLGATGAATGALIAFLIFYVSCLAITWRVYSRPGGLLLDVTNKRNARADAAKAANHRTHINEPYSRPSRLLHAQDRTRCGRSRLDGR